MNLDDKIRLAQRNVDQNPDDIQLGANLIRLLMQKGAVDPKTIQDMAIFGDPLSKILFPDQSKLDIRKYLQEKDMVFLIELAIYCAEKTLPILERYQNNSPREVIESLKSLLNNPSVENAQWVAFATQDVSAMIDWLANNNRLSAFYAASTIASAGSTIALEKSKIGNFIIYAGLALSVKPEELILDFIKENYFNQARKK